MRRRTGRVAMIAALALAAPVAGAGPAAAQDRPTPGGPCVQDEQPIRLSGLTSNEQLYAELQRLAARRSKVLDVVEIGRSLENRPLYSASVGTGAQKVMFITQQHGDEPLGTEAAMQLLKFLSGNSREAQAIRENLTVVVVPRVNPDGFERYLDYENLPAGVDPRRNAADQDINRFYDMTQAVPANVPEAAAVRKLVLDEDPDLILDYHHQVSYRTSDDQLVTMSVLWPTHPDVATDVRDDGKRAASVVDMALADFGHAMVTLYPTSTTRTVARNGLGIAGYPTLLVEQRGQQEVGQKGHGALTREALISMQAIVSLASGTFAAVDPEYADSMPARGERYDCEHE